jgi:hypothetical protein
MFLGNKKPYFQMFILRHIFLEITVLQNIEDENKTFIDIVIQINFRSGLGRESSGTIHSVSTLLLASTVSHNQTTNLISRK